MVNVHHPAPGARSAEESPALFALLAGVGLAFTSGGRTPHRGGPSFPGAAALRQGFRARRAGREDGPPAQASRVCGAGRVLLPSAATRCTDHHSRTTSSTLRAVSTAAIAGWAWMSGV